VANKHNTNRLRTACISYAAMGYLLVRGVITGAHTVGWNMPALAGKPGRWSGILLFTAGCMVIYLLRKGSGFRLNLAADFLVSALYVLRCAVENDWRSTASGCAAVITSIILSSNRCKPVRWLIFAMLPAIFLPVEFSELNRLRLASLCGVLSAAGMCGTALSVFDNFNEHNGMMWLIIGAALGMVI